VSQQVSGSQGALDALPYFSFTKSKTKIAHTPTVKGNWAN